MKLDTTGNQPMNREELAQLKLDLAKGLRGAVLPGRLLATIDELWRRLEQPEVKRVARELWLASMGFETTPNLPPVVSVDPDD